MAIFAVAWLAGTRSFFVVSGSTADAEQIVRFDPGHATTLWTSKTEMIARLRVSDDGAQLDVSAAAWNRNFGLSRRGDSDVELRGNEAGMIRAAVAQLAGTSDLLEAAGAQEADGVGGELELLVVLGRALFLHGGS